MNTKTIFIYPAMLCLTVMTAVISMHIASLIAVKSAQRRRLNNALPSPAPRRRFNSNGKENQSC